MNHLFLKSSLLLALAVSVAPACSVCFGDPESNMTQGMNFAIIGLLVVVMLVLATFGAFFVYLNKKAKSVQNAEG